MSYDFYLGRIDRLYLSKEGVLLYLRVFPEEPIVPNVLESSLEIATIEMPPYVHDTSEVELSLATHKRYRMKDISTIENRLKNIEYYTSLSLLESETANMTLRDSQTNLDRFKSGFFVDNFKSSGGGDVENTQYKASIDSVDGRLRPQHYIIY